MLTEVLGRVLNTFRTMVTDDDILEKEDMYILGRMKEFASNEEVVTFAAAKQLLILIERAVRILLCSSQGVYTLTILVFQATRWRRPH